MRNSLTADTISQSSQLHYGPDRPDMGQMGSDGYMFSEWKDVRGMEIYMEIQTIILIF
jgi:hypothetical protein